MERGSVSICIKFGILDSCFSSQEIIQVASIVCPDLFESSDEIRVDRITESKWETILEVLKLIHPYRIKEFQAQKRRESNILKGKPRLEEYYKEWVGAVKFKDERTCQKCCSHENLEAHHIRSIQDRPDLVVKLDNGITLCKECHLYFHSKYGKHGFGPEELIEFLRGDL